MIGHTDDMEIEYCIMSTLKTVQLIKKSVDGVLSHKYYGQMCNDS